ncbi:MAG: histidine kinase N-terminal 7TM domain-containing protein [Deltaproteobacteria bacterium]
MNLDIWFIFLCISLILVTGLGVYIFKIKNKKQIHYAFLSLMVSVFIWGFSLFLASLNNFSNMLYVYSYFFGVCFVPISITFLGLIFSHTKIDFNWKHALLFIFPIIDLIIIMTNPYHHLFFVKYNPINTLMQYGMFFLIHTIVSYIYILVGIGYLLYYSIKNSGFFSKQSLLIILGVFIPLVLNALENLNIVKLSTYTTPVAFSLGIICFTLAILKFKFLNIAPIALQNVVDQISDSYVIINEELEAIDYNKTFIDIFSQIFTIKRKETLSSILRLSGKTNNINTERLNEYITEAVKERKPVSFEKQIIAGEFDKYFAIEITPIIKNNSHIGTIILLKDITQHKKDMELIQQTQNQLLERERLASLGELAGGVAHDINTPLSSVQTILYSIDKSCQNVKQFIEANQLITPEITEDFESIDKRLKNGNIACERISKIVNSIRNHTRNLSSENIQQFYIMNVLDDVKVLINHQLKNSGCELVITEEEKYSVKGDPGKLGQVFTNLIVNAIQAYDDKPGKVEVNIGRQKNNAVITIADQAGGIPEMFIEGIFNKILTTKGTQGTGLGLYFSYSIITGHFGGIITFQSEHGKGTTFRITIPIKIDK